MKIYTIKQKQFLAIDLQTAWNFFSSPENLVKITPSHLGFDIVYQSGELGKTYAGKIIRYNLGIFPSVKTNWTTEITHVQEPHYFVDEQRFGPYALWHHQHFFKEVAGGIEMLDEVNYAVPFGLIGRMANGLFVARQLNRIFSYRFKMLSEIFPKKT